MMIDHSHRRDIAAADKVILALHLAVNQDNRRSLRAVDLRYQLDGRTEQLDHVPILCPNDVAAAQQPGWFTQLLLDEHHNRPAGCHRVGIGVVVGDHEHPLVIGGRPQKPFRSCGATRLRAHATSNKARTTPARPNRDEVSFINNTCTNPCTHLFRLLHRFSNTLLRRTRWQKPPPTRI